LQPTSLIFFNIDLGEILLARATSSLLFFTRKAGLLVVPVKFGVGGLFQGMFSPIPPGHIKLQYFCNNLKILQQTGLFSFNSALKNWWYFPGLIGKKNLPRSRKKHRMVELDLMMEKGGKPCLLRPSQPWLLPGAPNAVTRIRAWSY